MTHQIAVPHLPRPTLAKLIERNRKTILPAEVVKTFRECDVELGHLLTVAGANNTTKLREARRGDLNKAMENPLSPEAVALFTSARRRDEDARETANAAKNAARNVFVKKVAPRLAETFERVAAMLRTEAQVEADATRARADKWDMGAATACPLAASLRNEIEAMDTQANYSRKVAAGVEFMALPPRPSDVLRPVLGITL